MSNILPIEPTSEKPYIKENSFNGFFRVNPKSTPRDEIVRAIKILSSTDSDKTEPLLHEIIECLQGNSTTMKAEQLVSEYNCDEMSKISDSNLVRYLKGRFRYSFYPRMKRLHEFPPYLQIELSSACNYRCKFCFQTDPRLSKKSSGHIGTMAFDTFKRIIDQSLGNIDFISMASRGEPLLCKELTRFLEYMGDKFLCAKMNTNASMLTEKKSHEILSSGLHTLVFSADASEPELYSQLRVNGSLERVYSNIRLFNEIRNKHYPQSTLITRVSGVLYSKTQSFESLKEFWSPLVDQISMVCFCAWNDTYNLPRNSIIEPCSELWRRMYVWFDGSVNPCEADYLSTLSVGSIFDFDSLTDLWMGDAYQQLREAHLNLRRSSITPCMGCTIS